MLLRGPHSQQPMIHRVDYSGESKFPCVSSLYHFHGRNALDIFTSLLHISIGWLSRRCLLFGLCGLGLLSDLEWYLNTETHLYRHVIIPLVV